MTKQNILAGSAKHLEQTGLRPMEYLALDLVPKGNGCDFGCIDCCNARDTPSRRMPLKKIKPLIQEAKDLGARVVVFMGIKEPTLDPRFKRIVEEAHRNKMIPYVFSNAYHGLTPQMISFLHDHDASMVIQLKSLEERTFENHSQRKRSFKLVMQHLDQLRKIFSDTYRSEGAYGIRRIATNTVVDDTNKHEIKQIMAFCGNDLIPIFNTEMKIGAAENNPAIRTTQEIVQAIKTSAPDMIPLGTTSDGKWCAYMRNGIAIMEGQVLLCPYAIESAGKLGNTQQGLAPITKAANSTFDNFYRNEYPRCILRDEKYTQLIESLGK